VAANADDYAHFGGSLVRYLAENLPLAEELLCLTDCEPLALSEIARFCPDLERGITCDRAGYLGGALEERLRSRIAELFGSVSACDIGVENGAGYALLRVMQALLEPGDHVVVQTPAFPPLCTIPRTLGCRVSAWRANPERGFAFDLQALEGLLGKRTRLLVITVPSNPTGYAPTREEIDALVAIARARGLYVLCDEVYRMATDVDAGPLSPIADVYERGVSIGGVSKVYGLPGARVGFWASPDRALAASVARIRGGKSDVAHNVLGATLAESALANRPAILERNRRIVEVNLGCFRSFLAEHREWIRCDGPMAGPVVYPRLVGLERDSNGAYAPSPYDSATAFARVLLEATRTLVVPGAALDDDDVHVRIGLGRRRFPAALERLANHLRETARARRGAS
jgi:aspartate/methionine/tyrosine aminotransferase